MIRAKHQQLFDMLREEFMRGAWPKGSKLPNLKELSEQYSVSTNVASRAIDLLKNANLVNVKMGDGIYSIFSAPAALVEFKYSGDRLFGRYRGAKPLSVLVEDNTVWQLEFWNAFFRNFAEENPDIELDVHYAGRGSGQLPELFEIAIGGGFFLEQLRSAIPERLPLPCIKEFVPDLYDGCLFDASGVVDGRLLFGFSVMRMLAIPGTPIPRPEENVLDYIERLAGKNPDGYVIQSCTRMLENSGIDIFRCGRTGFSLNEQKKMFTVFERAKRLYRDGRLLWFHGKFSDRSQQADMLAHRNIRAIEYFSNTRNVFPENPDFRTLSYPHGSSPIIDPFFAVINANTRFPEECLRLVRKLLSPEAQRSASEQGIFRSLREEFLDDKVEDLLPDFKAGRVRFRDDSDLTVKTAIDYFLGWEFLYYLEGRRGPEVVELLDRKFRYYYSAVAKDIPTPSFAERSPTEKK